MKSSYEIITNEQIQEKIYLYLAIAGSIVVSVVVVGVALSMEEKNKIISSYGLILDFIGVTLASYTFIFPLKKKAQPGMQFSSNLPQYRAQALAEYADKHGLKLQIGFCLIALGFLMQLLGNWV